MSNSILQAIAQGAYQGYSYSYPHKTAYRSLNPAVPLREVWKRENLQSLLLYIHVPFCEHRCGFCNLFTRANPGEGLVAEYLAQLANESERVRAQLADLAIAQLAIGGGTPTFLETTELLRLFVLVRQQFDVDVSKVPTSIEVSPPTVDHEKLQLLLSLGVERISIGVQSFDDAESRQMGRPQQANVVRKSIELIRECDFPVLNIDLIYGGDGQTVSSFLHSLDEALRYGPDELYLYPLYVRPLTGLGRSRSLTTAAPGETATSQSKLEMYRAAREILLGRGYNQSSMRMFHRPRPKDVRNHQTYECQSDGMIGLGCGSRSYTRELHYSTDYAVSRAEVAGILSNYVNRDPSEFESARFGFRLGQEDQQRRFTLQSILQTDGLVFSEFANRFQVAAFEALPELRQLVDAGLAIADQQAIRLTPTGLEQSDVIGPWLYSSQVRDAMAEYEHR